MVIDRAVIDDMGRFERTEFINALTGPRSVYLIASCDTDGRENLALFSSIVHIGANPPLIGIVFRPDTVRRHTLENIRSTGHFTINAIHPQFIESAHQSSANYEVDISEFEAVGIEKEYVDNIAVPFVKASKLKIYLSLEEEYLIKANGTHMVIAGIEKVLINQQYLSEDGWVDVFAIDSVVCAGLSRYGQTSFLKQLDYARP